MNFAKNLLGKYGWKEGDGLGRDKNGITKPVKANYKFDHAGLGHNPADDMNNHWWENVYNQAATNLNVQTNESNEVLVGLNQAKSVEISTKNYSVQNDQKNADYGGTFLKSSTLTNQGREVEFADKQEISPLIMKIVSDEELFKACGGRTAHKGARHGLNLSGKLNRIEQQERELMKKMTSVTEDCSQVFKDYVDCKSRYNNKKLKKRLNKKKSRKIRKEREKKSTSGRNSSTSCTTTCDDDQNMDEEIIEKVAKVELEDKEEQQEKPKEKDKKKVKVENIKYKIPKRRLSRGRVDKRTKREQKKLKKLSREFHVSDTKDCFLKKMAIEEVPISFQPKSKKLRNSDDDVSLHSYRDKDEQTQSDSDDHIKQNILSHLTDKLKNVKKKKQKVIVENLTEFQLEHLRNAHVPFVELKESSRNKSRKSEAKFNTLAKNLVEKMSIL